MFINIFCIFHSHRDNWKNIFFWPLSSLTRHILQALLTLWPNKFRINYSNNIIRLTKLPLTISGFILYKIKYEKMFVGDLQLNNFNKVFDNNISTTNMCTNYRNVSKGPLGRWSSNLFSTKKNKIERTTTKKIRRSQHNLLNEI